MILNGFDDETNDFVESFGSIFSDYKSKYDEYLEKIKECVDLEDDYEYEACINSKWQEIMGALKVIDYFYIPQISQKTGKESKEKYNNQVSSNNKPNYPEGIMIHCPAGASTAKSVKSTLSGKGATVHFIIEHDSEGCRIFSVRPLEFQAWHCASGKKGSFNNSMISIEICDPPQLIKTKKFEDLTQKNKYIKIGSSYYYINNDKANEAYKKYKEIRNIASDLCAMLCCLFNFEIDKNCLDALNLQYPISVISHREGNVKYKRTSDHSDPDMLWMLYEHICDEEYKYGDLRRYLKKIDQDITSDKFKNNYITKAIIPWNDGTTEYTLEIKNDGKNGKDFKKQVENEKRDQAKKMAEELGVTFKSFNDKIKYEISYEYDYLKNEIMDPFRKEIAQKIEYYQNNPNNIHPLLRLMFNKAYKALSSP